MTKMSKDCLPPSQPNISEDNRKHPRFKEYMQYRSGMSNMLVTALSFDAWLRQTEETERPEVVVFQVRPWTVPASERPEGWLKPGWYKHDFASGYLLISRHGPFSTEDQAQAA